MIRVLLAEDSSVTRQYLVHLLEQDPMLEVVGQAADGEEAIALADALRPDVIVMDIQMPQVDGYEATRRIMERVPTPIVMVSAHSSRFDSKAFEALRAGALTLLNKPEGLDHPEAPAAARRLVATVKLMAEVRVVRRWAAREPERPTRPVAINGRRIRVVAIGASAGGPPTVAEILAELPASFPCPIFLVQHIAPGFAEGLAEWLGRSTALDVRLAADGAAAPGVVYVAPDGAQMSVGSDGRVTLTDDVDADGFRPSASYLIRSVARAYGASSIGVLLTGMGRDGAAGLLELRNAGGITIAQDKASSVVFGMPMEAIRLGAAEHVLSPARIAETIRELVEGRTPADRGKHR